MKPKHVIKSQLARKNNPKKASWKRWSCTIHPEVQGNAFLAIASFVVYLNALPCDFVFDDHSAIITNPDLRPNETSILEVFQHDFWGSPIHLEMSHKSYRPFTVLTFRLNYLFHGLKPAGYHFVNVLLHSVVVILFNMTSKIINCDSIGFSTYSMIGSILFAVHPVHTEAVAGVVGRTEELAAIFFFISLLSYHYEYFKIFGISTILSFLSKEQGITIVAVCIVYETTYNVFRTKEIHIAPNTYINQLEGRRILSLIAFGIILILLRFWIMGGPSEVPVFTKFDNPASHAPSPVRQLSYFYYAARNFFLLLYPLKLCCDWTMNSIPLIRTFADSRNFLTIVVVNLFLLLLWSSYKELEICIEKKTTKPPRLALILSLLIIPYLPASNMFIPVGFVLAERTLYLPSIGFCLLISHGLRLIYTSKNHKPMTLVMNPLILMTVFAFTLKTVTRASEWKNELTLFRSGIKVNPENAKLYNNLGHYYERQANWTQAMEYFQQASVISPDDLGSTLNIARTLINMGNYADAEAIMWNVKPQIKLSVAKSDDRRIAPHYLNLWINLGNLLSQNRSRLEEAKQIYYELISMRSDFIEAYINLGDVLIKQGNIEEAIITYERALAFNTHKIGELCYNLGVANSLLLDQHLVSASLNDITISIQIEKTSSYFFRSLEHNTKVVESLLHLAIMSQTYLKFMKPVKPQVIEKLKLYEGPDEERVWFNLGLLYSDDGDNKTAEMYLRKAIAKKRDYKSALFNLALIMIDSGRSYEAEMYLLQLLQFYPDHTKSLLLLGDVYSDFDELERAAKFYKRALDGNESKEVKLEAIRNLCRLSLRKNETNDVDECSRMLLEQHP